MSVSTSVPDTATAPAWRPSLASVVVAVQRLTLRLWFNDIARALGSRRQARLLVGALVALAAAYTVWSTAQAASSIGGGTLLTETTATAFAAIAVTVPAFTTIVTALYAPPRSLLTEVLSVLPLPPHAAALATRSLSAGIGFAVGLVLLVPLLAPTAVGGDSAAGWPVLCLLALAALGVLAALSSMVTLAALLSRWARVGSVLALGLAGLATATGLAYAFATAMPLNGNIPAGAHALISGNALLVSMGQAPLTAAGPACAVGLMAAGLLWAVERWAPDPATQARPNGLFAGRRGARATLTGLELRQILRFAPNTMLLVFVNGVAVLSAIALAGHGNDQLGLGLILLTMVSAWGVGGYGPTRRHHWIYRTTGRPHGWVWPKFWAVTVVWASMVFVHGSWLVALTDWHLIDLVAVLPTLFVELVTGCVVGMLLPVSRESSISGAVAEAASMVLLVAVGASAQSLMSGVESLTGILLAQGALLVGAVGAYAGVAYRVSARAALDAT